VGGFLGIGEGLRQTAADQFGNDRLGQAGVPSDRRVRVELVGCLPHRTDGEDHHLAYPLVE
jgi:hypothetical protein